MGNIIIIEDDLDIRELVIYSLKSNQLNGIGFDSGEAFFSSDIKVDEISLILLDVMLPKDDGLSILQKLRSNSKYEHIPVIMLTARGSEMDKVKALDLGADDYVVKPFGILELMSRINARLRNSKKVSKLTYKNIELDTDKYEVKVDNEVVTLTKKEYELLLYLVRNKGIVVEREVLIEKVWGFDFIGESRTLDIHISTLRKNLGESARLLKTVRGVGYMFGDQDA